MSFTNIQLKMGALFADTGLTLYPEDYKGDIDTSGVFGRYSILFGDNERSDYDIGKEISGLVLVRIFYDRSDGSLPALNYADTLSSDFQDTRDNGLSILGATLSNPQDDPDNEALAMMIWQVPFTQHL